uniref:CBS domain-containing protein n=1 Tax=Macrostomum lignano TaxID=282301 RepID=A0A1I8HTZ3_9PLAT
MSSAAELNSSCPVSGGDDSTNGGQRWLPPNHDSRCTFRIDKPVCESPHLHQKRKERPKILPDILHHIGNTPLVRVNNITKEEGIECEILVKCEFFNAGGSVKDRIGLRMIEDAERSGRLKPGDVLIEPTSTVLRALGADIVRTPTAASYDSAESHIGVAKQLLNTVANSHILDQYTHPPTDGPLRRHSRGDPGSVLGQLDMVVLGAGTGGTLCGVARKLKQRCPDCLIIGVDPLGSILAQPDELNATKVRFRPTVLDRSLVDRWYKSNDVDSLRMARRLIRREGLLCGGSSGSAFDCALRAVRDFGLGAGKRVVVLLPDSVRNYMTKFLSDDWMIERGHMPDPERIIGAGEMYIVISAAGRSSLGPSHAWMSVRVGSLDLRAPLTVAPDVSVSETLELFNRESIDQVPVVERSSGAIVGMATLSNITSRIIRGSLAPTDPVGSAAFDKFTKVTPDAKLGAVSRRLDTDHFVLVVQQQRQFGSAGEAVREFVYGILTRIDLLNFILKMQE